MPIVHVALLEGRSPETKAALIQRLTEAMVAVLGSEPARVRVLLHEIPAENWGIGGRTMRQSNPSPAEPT